MSELGWGEVAIAALCIAGCAWLVLMPSVAWHWRAPVVGVHFLVSVATQGLAVLTAIEAQAWRLRWPRLRYDTRRWATAFPLGMTAAASRAAASATRIGAFRVLAQILVWPAVVVCLVLAVAALDRATARRLPTSSRDV